MSCERREYDIIVEVRISYMDCEDGGFVTFGLLVWGTKVGISSRTNEMEYGSMVGMDEVIARGGWMNC